MELSRYLRWPGLRGRTSLSEQDLEAEFAQNRGPFSCLRTCQAWGPDDAPAAPEACGSDRSCFEASPRLRELS